MTRDEVIAMAREAVAMLRPKRESGIALAAGMWLQITF